MAVSAPEDRRFRRGRAAVVARRRRGWRARALRATLLVLIAGAMAALAAHEAVIASARLRVEHLVVMGNQRVPTAQILDWLEDLRGSPILRADLERWCARLRESPWVRAATMRRVLPATIEVVIAERQPLAIGRHGSRLLLVDAEGMVIDEFGPDYAGFDLPIIDGLITATTMAGSRPQSGAARLVASLLGELAADPGLLAKISQVDASDGHELAVWVDGDSTRLLVGDGDFRRRLNEYFAVRDALRARVPEIDTVDLRFDRRVFVTPAPAGDGRVAVLQQRPRAPS